LLAFEQRFESLQFRRVQFAATSPCHLLTQVMGEQIGKCHLSTSPCRHGGALSSGGFDVSRHVPQANKFQLPSGKKEHVFGFELADEVFFNVAQHGTPHEAHADRRGRCDRADVEAMQASNRCLLDRQTAVVASFQFPVALVGTQAFAALLQKLEAPLPLVVLQFGKTGGLAHSFEGLVGIKAWATGQRGEVLQQHIQRHQWWVPFFHQSGTEASAHCTELQQFQGIGGHEQHLGGAAR